MWCSDCGNDLWIVVGQNGAIENWRCETCGREELVHANSSLLAADLVLSQEPRFLLIGVWEVKPRASEIKRLRCLFPDEESFTYAKMVLAAEENTPFEIGKFSNAELNKLCPELEAMSLKLTQIPIGVG